MLGTNTDWEDTIVGPASATGPGARAILRMTGPLAHRIVGECLVWLPESQTSIPRPKAKSQKPKALPWRRTFVASVMINLRAWDRRVRASLYSWPQGGSFTGQPTAELHVPASSPILSALQTQLIENGARLARAGEFTLRAFLAGRLDLVQAEGVLGLIEAEDIEILRSAIDQRTGGLSRPVSAARAELLDLLADLEAGLDFSEEDIQFVTDERLRERLEVTKLNLSSLAEHLGRRAWESQPPRVVLVGPANAGKSSLFNALLGSARALVDSEAGTTRDYVSACLRLADLPGGDEKIDDGRVIELIDTAGQGPVSDESARRAAKMSETVSTTAELLIHCTAVDQHSPVGDRASPEMLLVRTKSDLLSSFHDPQADCITSVRQPGGLEQLGRLLCERLVTLQPKGKAGISERCRTSLAQALAALGEARTMTADRLGHEYVAVPIREALSALGEIVGEVYTDDLLDRIFSRFCIGK